MDANWRGLRRRKWRSRLLTTGGIGLALVAGTVLSGARLSGTGRTPAVAIAAGEKLFIHEWQPLNSASGQNDPLAAPGGDGLGPVFNARSCVACHFQGGVGGAGLNANNVLTFDVVPTRTNPLFHSGVVHADAVGPVNRECAAQVNETFPVVRGEQRRVNGCTVVIPELNPVKFTPINSPSLYGTGDIDRITARAIRNNQRDRQRALYPRELQGDFRGTPAGRVRILADGRVGKFGWKAQFATLEDFVATACAVEIGLSNPKRRQDRPHQQGEDKQAPADITDRQLFELTAFTAALPRPAQRVSSRGPAREAVHQGEALFASVGCADCHTPNLDAVAGIYSDLLLHRLEEDDSNGPYGRLNPDLPLPADQPLPNEWKTPPLWGVADTAPYFHDGQSPTLETAILRHGSQAQRVTERFKALSPDKQQALIEFLRSLRLPATERATGRMDIAENAGG